AERERDRLRVGVVGGIADPVGDGDRRRRQILDLIDDADLRVRGDGVLRKLGVDANVVLAPDGAARVAHVDLRGLWGGGCEKNGEGEGTGAFHCARRKSAKRARAGQDIPTLNRFSAPPETPPAGSPPSPPASSGVFLPSASRGACACA